MEKSVVTDDSRGIDQSIDAARQRTPSRQKRAPLMLKPERLSCPWKMSGSDPAVVHVAPPSVDSTVETVSVPATLLVCRAIQSEALRQP